MVSERKIRRLVNRTMVAALLALLSIPAATFLFVADAEAQTNFASSPGAVFPSGGQATDTISVNNCGTVQDIDMDIDVEHPWRGDTSIFLQSPNGTQYALKARPGTGSWGDSTPDIVGNFNQNLDPLSGDPTTQVVHPISDFVGTNADGQWTVTVSDEYGQYSGTLHYWALNITCSNSGSGANFSSTPQISFVSGGSASNTISVNGCETVDSINMDIAVTHPYGWSSDYTVKLRSPNGSQYVLRSRYGVAGVQLVGNFNQTLGPNSGYAGEPAHPISVFEGTAGNGAWTVTVDDELQFSEPNSVLHSWGLNLECSGQDSQTNVSNLPPPPPPSGGQWNFDPSCSASEISEVGDPKPGNALFMLDQSGSMGFSYVNGKSLWNIARDSIHQATNSLNDKLRFGIGFFSNSSANIPVTCNDMNHGQVTSAIDSRGPGGGTPTAAGFNALANSQCLNDPNYTGAGILITDGVPNYPQSNAVTAACNARAGGYTNYVVGLGGGTDQAFNNKMAAAAGTGSCTVNGNPVDPCQDPGVNKSNCEGAYYAGNQTEFQNVLLEVSEEIQCTFPVDTSLHVSGEAPDDPEAVSVQMYTASGWISIQHRNVSGDGEGWYYPSGESNEMISLTADYCGDIQEGHVDAVSTQLACDCTLSEGNECTVNNPGPGECGEGTIQCVNGYGQCQPNPLEECMTGCEDHVAGDACNVADFDLDLRDIAEGETFRSGDSALSRCDVGEVICVDVPGEEVPQPICDGIYRPMPETCDGMDNDCDGNTDNIEDSWSDWFEGQGVWEDMSSGFAPTTEGDGPMCGMKDICSCRNGARDEHAGTGSSMESEFENYLDGWDDGCSCIPPLRP